MKRISNIIKIQCCHNYRLVNMPLTIYKVNASPPARAVLMTAELLKLKYGTTEVNIFAGEHKKPDYLEINPLHTVPLLKDGDFILVDSHAIITYLVSKYGADKRAELYPSDLILKATIDQRLYFDATILFPALVVVVKGIRYQNSTGPNKEQIEKIIEAYGVLEKYLEKSKFVACNYMTLTDISCVATLSSLNAILPVDKKYEKVHSWWNRVKEEEWYQKANVPGLEQLTNFVKAAMEKNGS